MHEIDCEEIRPEANEGIDQLLEELTLAQCLWSSSLSLSCEVTALSRASRNVSSVSTAVVCVWREWARNGIFLRVRPLRPSLLLYVCVCVCVCAYMVTILQPLHIHDTIAKHT